MRILYYFGDYHTPMTRWQYDQIIDELNHHDCHIFVLNPLEYESINQANEVIIEKLKSGRYDMFMTCHYDNYLFPDTIKEIRRISIPSLLICFDNLLVPFAHKNVAPLFDLVWLTSKETAWYFEKIGAKWLFLPYAANPYKKGGASITTIGVGFVGNPYGSRINTINKLTRAGIDVFVHSKSSDGIDEKKRQNTKTSFLSTIRAGVNYARFKEGRFVLAGAIKNRVLNKKTIENNLYYHELEKVKDLYEAYSRYSITLSSTTARNTGVLKHPVYVVNLRSFEIPMAGGVQFCHNCNEIKEYFEDEREAIFFEDDIDMVVKAKYYLRPENEHVLYRIRYNARQRAEREHTWYKRFCKVFDEFGLTK